MKQIKELAWFDNGNYKVFETLDERQLGFELKERAQIFNAIEGLKESFPDDWAKHSMLKLQHKSSSLGAIFEGKPSLTQDLNVLPRKKLKDISDLDDEENVESLVHYQMVRTLRPIQNKGGVRLRLGCEIESDFENMNALRQQLESKINNQKRLDMFMDFLSIGEVPITANGIAGVPGFSIPLSLNIVDYTDAELTTNFLQLLKDMRNVLEIDEPKREKKRSKTDIDKLLKYRVFQFLDLWLWRDLFYVDIPDARIIETVLWGSDYDSKKYYNGISQFIKKVTAEHYSLL